MASTSTGRKKYLQWVVRRKRSNQGTGGINVTVSSIKPEKQKGGSLPLSLSFGRGREGRKEVDGGRWNNKNIYTLFFSIPGKGGKRIFSFLLKGKAWSVRN